MNLGAITCLTMGGIFVIIAILFAILKEKGAMLISGFNTMPKEKREQYDKLRMSQDMRNQLFLWSIIFFIGAVLCYFISSYIVFLAFAVWAFFFFKEVHLDEEKAFKKYKKF